MGVTLDNRLTLKNHLETVVIKAKVRARQLYHIMRRNSFGTKKLKLKVYKTYLRLIITLAEPAINEAAKSNIKKLQIFQNNILIQSLNRTRSININKLHNNNIEKIHKFLQRISMNFDIKNLKTQKIH